MKMRTFLTLGLLFSSLNATAQAGPAEKELEAKLERQLEALLGPGKAHVSVSGKTEDPSMQRSVTRSKPQIVGQRQTTVSSRNGETQSTTQTSSQTSWTYDQTEEIRSVQPKLTDKSVSIVYEPPSVSDDSEEGSRPNLDAAAIEQMARAALGLEETDRIHVQAGRMDTSAYDRLKAEMERAQQGTPIWVLIGIALACVGLGAGLGAFLMRRRRSSQASAPDWQQAWNPETQAYPYTQSVQPIQSALPPGNPIASGPHGPVIHVQPPSN